MREGEHRGVAADEGSTGEMGQVSVEVIGGAPARKGKHWQRRARKGRQEVGKGKFFRYDRAGVLNERKVLPIILVIVGLVFINASIFILATDKYHY